MEEGGSKVSATKKRRSLSMDQTDNAKSPSTPNTLWRSSRLAAKYNKKLELINENETLQSPKAASKKALALEKSNNSAPNTPKKKTRSTTSMEPDSASLTPRALRAARRLSQIGSDSELTPIKVTRRSRKNSSTSLENLGNTMSEKKLKNQNKPDINGAEAESKVLSPKKSPIKKLISCENQATELILNEWDEESKYKKLNKHEEQCESSTKIDDLSPSENELIKSKLDVTKSLKILISPLKENEMQKESNLTSKKENLRSSKSPQNKSDMTANKHLDTIISEEKDDVRLDSLFSHKSEKDDIGIKSSLSPTKNLGKVGDKSLSSSNEDSFSLDKEYFLDETEVNTCVLSFKDKNEQDPKNCCVTLSPLVRDTLSSENVDIQKENVNESNNIDMSDHKKNAVEVEKQNLTKEDTKIGNYSCEPMDIDETICSNTSSIAVKQTSSTSLDNICDADLNPSLKNLKEDAEKIEDSSKELSLTSKPLRTCDQYECHEYIPLHKNSSNNPDNNFNLDTPFNENNKESDINISMNKDLMGENQSFDSITENKVGKVTETPVNKKILSESLKDNRHYDMSIHKSLNDCDQGSNIHINKDISDDISNYNTTFRKNLKENQTPIKKIVSSDVKTSTPTLTGKKESNNVIENAKIINGSNKNVSTEENINDFFDEEAEDVILSYHSGDSQDESDKEYEKEHEIVEKGETLSSEEEYSDESDIDDYEKGSFIVSSDEEDNVLLSGSGDDLSLSDNELTMSAKSKQKYNKRKQKEQKKASREMYESRHIKDKFTAVTSNSRKRKRIESSASESHSLDTTKNNTFDANTSNSSCTNKLNKYNSLSEEKSEDSCEIIDAINIDINMIEQAPNDDISVNNAIEYSSSSDNEEISQNYNDVLKNLNQNKNTINQSLTNKKNKKIPIIDNLNLTQPKIPNYKKLDNSDINLSEKAENTKQTKSQQEETCDNDSHSVYQKLEENQSKDEIRDCKNHDNEARDLSHNSHIITNLKESDETKSVSNEIQDTGNRTMLSEISGVISEESDTSHKSKKQKKSKKVKKNLQNSTQSLREYQATFNDIDEMQTKHNTINHLEGEMSESSMRKELSEDNIKTKKGKKSKKEMRINNQSDHNITITECSEPISPNVSKKEKNHLNALELTDDTTFKPESSLKGAVGDESETSDESKKNKKATKVHKDSEKTQSQKGYQETLNDIDEMQTKYDAINHSEREMSEISMRNELSEDSMKNQNGKKSKKRMRVDNQADQQITSTKYGEPISPNVSKQEKNKLKSVESTDTPIKPDLPKDSLGDESETSHKSKKKKKPKQKDSENVTQSLKGCQETLNNIDEMQTKHIINHSEPEMFETITRNELSEDSIKTQDGKKSKKKWKMDNQSDQQITTNDHSNPTSPNVTKKEKNKLKSLQLTDDTTFKPESPPKDEPETSHKRKKKKKSKQKDLENATHSPKGYQTTFNGNDEMRKELSENIIKHQNGKKSKKNTKVDNQSDQQITSTKYGELILSNVSKKEKSKLKSVESTDDTPFKPESIQKGIIVDTHCERKKKRKHPDTSDDVINTDISKPVKEKTLMEKSSKKRKIFDDIITNKTLDPSIGIEIKKKKTKAYKTSLTKTHDVQPFPEYLLSQLEESPSPKKRVLSTTDFIVEDAEKIKIKPSNYLEESIIINADSPLTKKRKKNNKKDYNIPKVLPYVPTASTSHSGLTTDFKVNVLPKDTKFVSQSSNMTNFKDEYLHGNKVQRLGTFRYEQLKKRKGFMSKF